ncbi:MAG: T9SS C-terminal target domain-containing protein [Balneolaceae bacterium]|nr:MAG: T9SS C-terminal target domain-containing protein [Balneolaceae bacterium]
MLTTSMRSIHQIPLVLMFLLIFDPAVLNAQESSFPYSVRLEQVSVPGLPGFHSFAYGQHDGKWLIVGGRTDGIHARQPFASFPPNHNNDHVFVIDPLNGEFFAERLDPLSSGLREHLQSTNMNFHQIADTLYIIGGYAFSETAGDHITFPKLTTIVISETMNDVMSGSLNEQSFGHLYDERFAVTGGQLGELNDKLILVGGHRFDGRYNPRDMPTFRQEYTHAIQSFRIDHALSGPEISFYSKVADTDHLRRRDYNLVPYMFRDGEPGYMISTGVFQRGADLPFLYNVEIGKDEFYNPIPDFEQLLSHYHSPKLSFYTEESDELHMLFFGGLAQFYFQGNRLIQDDRVPFVNTISRVTRFSDGSFAEFALPEEMPGLKGTSAEFIPNPDLPKNETGVILMDEIEAGKLLVGYIVGGIDTPIINPFATNQSDRTSASTTVYEVWLDPSASENKPVKQIRDGAILYPNYPNPFDDETTIHFSIEQDSMVDLDIFSVDGRKIAILISSVVEAGEHKLSFSAEDLASGVYIIRLTANGLTKSRAITIVRSKQ